MVENSENKSLGTELIGAIDSTVPKTVKAKIQRALARFIAGGVGFEAWEQIRENIDTIEGRSLVNMALAKHVANQAIADPDVVERAKARFLGDLAHKQENIEAVAISANSKAEQFDEGSDISTEDTKEPSQDWMNCFIREAEMASSDELRDQLGAVLAGEAKKPGTFSKSTVRYIAEIDRETLLEFKKVNSIRLGKYVLKDGGWSSGEWFGTGILLENAGLISGVAGQTHNKFHLGKDGSLVIGSDKLLLELRGKPEMVIQAPCWIISKLGMEIAALLDAPDPNDVAQHIVQMIPKNRLEAISMVSLIGKASGGIIRKEELKTIWKQEG